jgi:hypothetical protein
MMGYSLEYRRRGTWADIRLQENFGKRLRKMAKAKAKTAKKIAKKAPKKAKQFPKKGHKALADVVRGDPFENRYDAYGMGVGIKK